MNVQARCEEKLRTDRLFSLFFTAKENSNINSNYRIGRENVFSEVSKRMFSETMSAFTEIAEKDPNKDRK